MTKIKTTFSIECSDYNAFMDLVRKKRTNKSVAVNQLICRWLEENNVQVENYSEECLTELPPYQ